MGVSDAMAVIFGASVATLLPGNILTTVFGVVIIAGATRMFTAKPKKVEGHPPENVLPYVPLGLPLGFATGLIGIGGGVLMIPVMIGLLNYIMHQAVGTSTGLMIFTAIRGTIL